jgi:hypothetical protein
MRKQSIGLDETPAARPAPRLPRLVVGVMLAAVSVPIVFEGVLLCVANWKAAMGMSAEVRTPALDWSCDLLGRLQDEIGRLILPCFQHVPWQPSHVLAAAGVAMTLSMLMLRR